VSKFVTNKNKLLEEVINDVLPTTKNVDFLVGYFYFSGFQELVDRLEDKKLRVLVGMDVEREILGKVKQYREFTNQFQNGEKKSTVSRQNLRDNFYKDFVRIFNDTDFFDSQEKIRSFKTYLEKIRDGSLEIRKTKEPNHAKLYLFQKLPEYNEGGEYPGVMVTGSSNLSYSGLKGQAEANVQLRDKQAYREGERLFEELWQNAVVLADEDHISEFEEKVRKKIWYKESAAELPSPYEVYIKVLDEYFSFEEDVSLRLPSEMTEGKMLNLEYQIDAIKQGRQILNKHNGVIIADVVGLGKSIIASAIAQDAGLETKIICPPHLKDQWEDYRYDFNLKAKVYSSGIIERVVEEERSETENSEDQKLIIVDEAHRFRNEDSKSYRYLHELCQGNKVILMTATPFNNRPQDIFSMIKLFQVPAKSTLQTVDSLSLEFKNLVKRYKKLNRDQREGKIKETELKNQIEEIAEKIRLMVEPLVIRRTRIDLEKIPKYKEDLEKQDVNLNTPEPPRLVEYDLGDLKSLYEDTLENIVPEIDEEEGYRATRYMPLAYVKEEYEEKVQDEFGEDGVQAIAQKNVASFMKRLLVRRFESSIPAFFSTLNSLIDSAENILDWYNYQGKVPIFKKGDIPDLSKEVVDSWDEEEAKEYFEDVNPEEEYADEVEKGMLFLDTEYLNEGFIDDHKSDLKILKKIKREWDKDLPDPKFSEFKSRLREHLQENPDRKIIVFSEFSDTVEYLHERLEDDFDVMKYSSDYDTKANKRRIKKNFDAGLNKSDQKDAYDILVATDAISEGFNLHRAGIVYNYDIPYNPTKVIQRIGRINRVSEKVFDKLYTFNFFPSEIGESEIRTKAISSLKMQMIHNLLGEDMQVLTQEEDVESVFYNQYKDLFEQEEEESWDTAYRQELENLKQNHPEIYESAKKIPRRSKIRRSKKTDKSGVLVFAEKGGEYKFKIGKGAIEKEQEVVPPKEALNIFKASKEEEPRLVSSNFDDIYQSLKKNLFKKRSSTPKSRSAKKAINQVEYLLENYDSDNDYLKDLQTTLKVLDGLPQGHVKTIKNLDLTDPKEAIEKLKGEIEPNYLKRIIRAGQRVEEGDEKLILAEEVEEG